MPGRWQSLKNQPAFNTSTMILLSDGRVMVQEEATKCWHALAPDENGGYIGGTWSPLKEMSFWRRYYASGILNDGRFFLCGGEDNDGGKDADIVEIYNPVTGEWTKQKAPPCKEVADAACCVLPDGRILMGAKGSEKCFIHDPAKDKDPWSATGSQCGETSEQTWILLPDDTIVTVRCVPPYTGEKYIISSGTWQNEGSLPVTIVDHAASEIGPGMLMHNGKVIFFGAANSGGCGKTVIYTPPATPTEQGTWAAGPDIPNLGRDVMVSNDCPAVLLPNGKVLFTAAKFLRGGSGSPVYFFEYDPVAKNITEAPTPPNNGKFPDPEDPGIKWSRLLLLPTGQVLFSASSNNVQVYTPDGVPQESWRPTVTSITSSASDYLLQGRQLNGLSQANIYGDDCYCATNYPLVQLTNPQTHQVHYCRTHDFSTMGVATGASLQSAHFTVGDIPAGTYELRVIANGISSHAFRFDYDRPTKVRR